MAGDPTGRLGNRTTVDLSLTLPPTFVLAQPARMVELVDTTDLNSVDPNGSCGFKSRW